MSDWLFPKSINAHSHEGSRERERGIERERERGIERERERGIERERERSLRSGMED